MVAIILVLIVARLSYSTHLSGKVCEKYFYGDECEKECHRCDEPCNNVTGRCVDGCTPGWKGERCDEGCVLAKGETYRGNMSVSYQGLPCIPWGNAVDLNAYMYQAMDFHLNHNFCRNPKGKFQAPFCYVRLHAYQYCEVPTCPTPNKTECEPYHYGEKCIDICNFCPEPCNNVPGLCMYGCKPGWTGERCDTACLFKNGFSYRGTLSTTINGSTCLHWDEYSSRKGDYHNYCRTWDALSLPWCFVDTGRGILDIEYCKIDECPENAQMHSCQNQCYQCKETCNNVTGMCTDGCSPGWTGEKCDNETTCYYGDGTSYRGTWSITVDGETCDTWDWTYMKWLKERNRGISANHNYCRNTHYGKNVWCYVGLALKLCSISTCSEQQTVTPKESTIESSTEYVTSYYVADDWNVATTPLPTMSIHVTIVVYRMAVVLLHN